MRSCPTSFASSRSASAPWRMALVSARPGAGVPFGGAARGWRLDSRPASCLMSRPSPAYGNPVAVRIEQDIVVPSQSARAIVVGKQGVSVGVVGKAARMVMEEAWQRRVHLILNVKIASKR